MSNNELTTLDSSSLVTATGGRSVDPPSRSAVGDNSLLGQGATAGGEQVGKLQSLADRIKTIYAPTPTFPAPPIR